MPRTRSFRRALLGLVALTAVAGAAVSPAVAAPPPTPKVLFVGDSLSQNIAEALIAQGKVNTVNGGTVNCTVGNGILQGYKNQVLYSGCQTWETDFAAAVAQHDPDVVVLVTGGWEIVNRWLGPQQGPPLTIKDQAFKDNYLAALDKAGQVLSAGGAKVVMLTTPYMDPPHAYPEPGTGDITEIWWEPYGPTDPPDEWVPPTPDTPFVSGHDKVDAANEVIREFGSHGVATILDLNKRICPGGKYREKVKGKSIRFKDNIHLSKAGQKYVAKWLAPKLIAIASG